MNSEDFSVVKDARAIVCSDLTGLRSPMLGKGHPLTRQHAGDSGALVADEQV